MIINDRMFRGFAGPSDCDPPFVWNGQSCVNTSLLSAGASVCAPGYIWTGSGCEAPGTASVAAPSTSSSAPSTDKGWFETLIEVGGGLAKTLLGTGGAAPPPVIVTKTPSWVLPVAIGGGALVLALGTGLIVTGSRKKPAMAGYRTRRSRR